MSPRCGGGATIVGMPELPEMQALAERLDEMVGGATLERADLLQFSGLKTFEPPLDAYVGERLESVGRRGKYLIWDFGGPRLLIHLSQGGRVEIEHPPKQTRPKGAVLRLGFDAETGMTGVLVREYGTQRKAGAWTLAPGDEGPLGVLGPEPFSDGFAETIRSSTDGRRVHTVLRDQKTVAGIGRGFSDDALHEARLSPYAAMSKLSDEERERLIDAVHIVLERGLASERKRTGGLPAKLPGRFTVHGHHGRPCPRCGETLQRVSYEDYEIVYCPTCQTGGKVLADRRLSRLVK
jgi:formamidopyrimidine-DNA glycosylase